MMILWKIFYFIIAIGPLIFVHELGHFLLAKLMGVSVEKFSLGFGPKLIGKKIGETEYLLSAFPLGGYVKMFGEAGYIEGGNVHNPGGVDNVPSEELPLDTLREMTDEEKARSFAHKTPLARIAIVIAGPVFNLFFAWLCFIVLCMLGIPSVTSKVGTVLKDKPAARAGLQNGDTITSINSRPINRWDQITEAITASNGNKITLTVMRESKEISFSMTPEARVSKNLFGEDVNGYAIGVASAGEKIMEYYNPFQAVVKGMEHTWNVIDATIMSIVKMAQRKVPMDQVGGPIMIADMAGKMADAGGSSFLYFMAAISINLGVLNLLPVPVLDGGHLVFYLLEIVIRRPVSQKVREYAQQVGMVLLLGLMVLAFYNDIIRYIVG